MKKRKFHIIIGVVLGIVVLVAASLYGISSYMPRLLTRLSRAGTNDSRALEDAE